MSICGSRSNIVKTVVIVVLLLFLITGLVWYLLSPVERSVSGSLKVIPQINEGSLIRFKQGDGHSIWNVTKAIDNDLKPYNSSESFIDHECSFNKKPEKGKTCAFDLKSMDPCTSVNAYGYSIGKPCVFLKLTSLQTRVPKFYNAANLPEAMPQDLKDDIKSYVETRENNANIIWVSCEGKTPDDVKNVGSINYRPRRGFPGFYLPCLREDNCTEPLIAIHFEKLTRQVEINIQCTAWAENIHETVDFELFLE